MLLKQNTILNSGNRSHSNWFKETQLINSLLEINIEKINIILN